MSANNHFTITTALTRQTSQPKGLYFTAVVFFFRHLISEVTKQISTKLGQIFF